MANANLGTKRRCTSCEAPFYDLNRTQITCPKCDAPFVPEPPPTRRSSAAVRFRNRVAAKAPEPVAAAREPEAEAAIEAEDDTIPEPLDEEAEEVEPETPETDEDREPR